MKEEPPELSASGRNISPALDHIVKHCIEKRAEHRFQSATDIAFNLAEQTSPPAVTAARGTSLCRVPAKATRADGARVVVLLVVSLPCARSGGGICLRTRSRSSSRWPSCLWLNASADSSVDYLSDGITDSLIDSLSPAAAPHGHVARLGLPVQGPADQCSGGRTQLNVQAVLKGQFVQRAQDLVISAELVNVRDNSHLWSASSTGSSRLSRRSRRRSSDRFIRLRGHCRRR